MCKMRSLGFALALGWLFPAGAGAAEDWSQALARMPLPRGTGVLARTNSVEIMLGAFQSNSVVKAVVFMPGATDEFYMFRRARAVLTNTSPTLLDAVAALTNQTQIRATFRAPLLLLHSDEDPLDTMIRVDHPATAEKLQRARFLPHAHYNDRDWDTLQPQFKKRLKVDVKPWRYSYDSWHFYRHSFAGWNLTGWEALQAAALAGKSRYTVERNRVVFACDKRTRATPKLDAFPRD